MNFYTEEKRILQEAMNKGKLIVFVGAGVSASSGMPLWKEAIKPFTDGLGLESLSSYDNLKIPQMYYNARGRKEYVDLARYTFKYGKSLPVNIIHDCIMEMNVNQIITTNYDHLLEEAALKHNRIYQVISKDEDIPYTSGNRRIIKMHGDFENDNFVLKEDDYLNYSSSFGMIETYCKSVIASNVVLFIGYSFNDPDVKQIFNWIKVTLKKNFQRAYLIDAVGEYAEHDVQYFKNRGVNVLYASKEVTNYKKKDITIRTVEMIRALFFDKKEHLDLITHLYNALQEYEMLAYIPRKYVLSALRECDLIVDNGYIRLYKKELRKYLPELKRIGKNSDNLQVQLIQKAFRDCGIVGVFDEEGMKRTTIKFNYRFERQPQMIEKYLWKFDYLGLKQYLKNLECLALEDNLKQKQELVYGYYVLGEHEKAFGLSKQISMAYYRKGNFFDYFISEYNRRVEALIISGPLGAKDVNGLLESECSEKRLQEILTEISYSQARNYKLLNDLLQNSLLGKYFEEITALRDREKEQAETCYAFFGAEPAVDTIRSLQRDCYHCWTDNLLLGDIFSEYKRVFRVGTQALMESLGIGKKVRLDSHFMGDTTENIIVDQLTAEDIFFLVKYMSKKELAKALRECNVKEIKTSKDVQDYLQSILDNILKYMNKYEDKKSWIENELNLIGLLLEKMQIEVALQLAYLNAVIKALQIELLQQDTVIISNCIVHFEKDTVNKELQEPLTQILYILLNKAIKSVYYIEHTGRALFSNVVEILNAKYQFVLAFEWTKKFECENLDILLPELSLICNEYDLEEIQQYILNKFETFEPFEIDLYARALMANLLEPCASLEEKAYHELKRAQKEPGNEIPNRFVSAMHNMVTLFLNDKLIDPNQLQQIMLQSDRKQWVFLADMDRFDYNEFQVEWLDEFSTALCLEIGKNQMAKSELQRIFAKTWNNKRSSLSESVLGKFFKIIGNE